MVFFATLHSLPFELLLAPSFPLCQEKLGGFFLQNSNPHTFSIENKPMELFSFFLQPFLNFFFFIIFSCHSTSFPCELKFVGKKHAKLLSMLKEVRQVFFCNPSFFFH